eukprot:TRINITY_DN14007_c0_g1_i2.p1 TRINITY_DN14007_c0_g1~~TRINITY_DN14007_c0_g1_i2.p1  ORF type:complete len:147 (-),score=58.91 TRINITY_DN14007_c0_g1_i2:122-520(-)
MLRSLVGSEMCIRDRSERELDDANTQWETKMQGMRDICAKDVADLEQDLKEVHEQVEAQTRLTECEAEKLRGAEECLAKLHESACGLSVQVAAELDESEQKFKRLVIELEEASKERAALGETVHEVLSLIHI